MCALEEREDTALRGPEEFICGFQLEIQRAGCVDDCMDISDCFIEGAWGRDIGDCSVFEEGSVDCFEGGVCEEARGCLVGAGCSTDGVALLKELKCYV